MIITRTPLRISIGGGGTDLPSYYERYGGFVVSAAISQYIFAQTTFARSISGCKPFERVIGRQLVAHDNQVFPAKPPVSEAAAPDPSAALQRSTRIDRASSEKGSGDRRSAQ
jgi:hypothetical protein